jgi:hypothetical protein
VTGFFPRECPPPGMSAPAEGVCPPSLLFIRLDVRLDPAEHLGAIDVLDLRESRDASVPDDRQARQDLEHAVRKLFEIRIIHSIEVKAV